MDQCALPVEVLHKVDDSTLGPDDCFQVESEVIDIAHKWQQFGGALRIRQAKLEEIKAGSGSAPRECLTKTVQEFLKKNYDLQEHGQPSWRQVVIAVGYKAGGADTELALQIANDHPMKAPSKKKSDSASVHDFSLLMEASRTGDVETAKMLLDHGADPNLANAEGWTALMAAARNGRYGSVDLLLERGANTDMQDHSGWSALMAAVYKRHDEVALRIIQAGATPHLQDKNHTNAILLAIATNEQVTVVESLLERVEDPSQLDLQDSFGETVLIFACKNRNLELVKRLLSMKANPNLCNNHGETPVLISTKRGDTETVQELLDNYADPNMGNTHPLMVAINLGYKEIAKLLVVNGADIYKEHEGGVLAFEMAELRNFTDLARRLNPQQFTSRTPRDVLRLTIKSLATVQKHLSLGPLRLVKTDDKKGWLPGFLQHMLQRTHVQ